MTRTTTEAPATAGASGVSGDLLPVGSYARRSKKKGGDGKGATINIADQHAQNRAYAAHAFPGHPVIEYDDNMSAWNPDVFRADWERMLEDTRAGQLHAVIGRYADRLTRQPEQGEYLLSACKKSGAQLHTTSAGQITSALAFRIELAIAAEESDQKSRRMLDKHRTLIESGGFSGGRRAFGYTERMEGINQAEADALNDAYSRILNGESISSIARLWNRARIKTAAGNDWEASTVSKLLRSRHPLAVRDNNGVDVPASWEAIADPVTHAAVIRRLDARRADNKSAGYSGARTYELSGVVVCAECGRTMNGKPTHMKSGPAYTCLSRRGHGSAPTANVWRIVRRAVCVRLTQLDAAGVFVAEADRDAARERQAERATLNARLEDELPAWLADGVSPATVAKAEARINARLAELDAADDAETEAISARNRVLAGLVGLPLEDTCAAFDALPLDRQRTVIAELGTPVLRRLPSRKGVFNPRRVLFVWADGRLDTAEAEDIA